MINIHIIHSIRSIHSNLPPKAHVSRDLDRTRCSAFFLRLYLCSKVLRQDAPRLPKTETKRFERTALGQVEHTPSNLPPWHSSGCRGFKEPQSRCSLEPLPYPPYPPCLPAHQTVLLGHECLSDAVPIVIKFTGNIGPLVHSASIGKRLSCFSISSSREEVLSVSCSRSTYSGSPDSQRGHQD